jgi:signal transduction protein with GAF and PtsI domain
VTSTIHTPPARVPVGPDPVAAELVQSVVDVARAIFGAQASSVFLLDEDAHELIFQAVSGRGEETLVGRRLPASVGIAGWVIASGEALVIDDLTSNQAFDRELAQSTEYVPTALMAAPLIHGDRILGVLEVLDPVAQARSSLSEVDLLAMFARQAAAALRVIVDRVDADRTPVRRVDERATVLQLMATLQRMLDDSPNGEASCTWPT